MDWHVHIQRVLLHIVKITTPDTTGTGFLLNRLERGASIMTAAHVVRNAQAWKQTIRVHHRDFPSGEVVLPDEGRALALHGERDSACLTFGLPPSVGGTKEYPFPEEAIEIVPEGDSVKMGVEVGWLGYPDIVPGASFFSGHVSAVTRSKYFVDGIAVPGVSGGPAFYYDEFDQKLRILGSVTSYHRAGEVLPGLMVAENIGWASSLQRK